MCPSADGKGDGTGLLLLYPVSKDSRPVRSAQTREELRAVEHVLGVGLVFPESRSHTARVDYVTANVAALDAGRRGPRRGGRARGRRGRSRLIDDVRVALTALRSGGVPPTGDLRFLPVQGRHDALVGLDELRRPHLLLALGGASETSLKSDVAALQIAVKPLVVDGKSSPYLDVTCLFDSVDRRLRALRRRGPRPDDYRWR